MTGLDAACVLRRLEAQKAKRQPHERIWRDCFDYSMPELGGGLNGSLQTLEQINAKHSTIFDSTAADGMRHLASAIMSGLTPPNGLWFNLDVGQSTHEERVWLDDAADVLFKNIHQANFDAEAFEAQLQLVGAGWFVLYIDEDRERGGLVFERWPLAQCWFASSQANGVVDMVWRQFELSAEAAVASYGEDKVSKQVKKDAEKNPDAKHWFVHYIGPREKSEPDARLAKNLPIASIHVEVGKKSIARESGYHEFPCAVPRWIKLESGYGVGPMAAALPDIKTLNMLKSLELDNLDIAVAGMWIAEDDGVLNPATVRIGARKIIVANSTESMKPLVSGANFEIGFAKAAELQRSIRKILLADQLQPNDGPQMTATEVHVRVNLVRQLLGPIYGRLQAEYLRPVIDRSFGLALRAGALGEPPESLRGRNYSVRYVSPLARAQRLEDVTAMDRFEMSLAALAQGGKPEASDNYDFDLASRTKAELLGVPSDLVRDEKAVSKLRDQRAEQQAKAKQDELMQQGAAAAAEAGGAKAGAG